MSGQAVICATEITKHFDGVTALQGVSFAVQAGEIHALCGENGAGKSTLIKILSGFYPAGTYSGELSVRGRLVSFRNVRDAERQGIVVIHQELALVESLTVAENLFLGNLPCRCWQIDWLAMSSRAHDLLQQFGLDIDPQEHVSNLGVGQQQMVEILRGLAKQPNLLILDEPTAALSDKETEMLHHSLRLLRSQGVACIYISHKLEEVLTIANNITVLRDGRAVASMDGAAADTRALIRHMVGRDISTPNLSQHESLLGTELMRVEGLSAHARNGSRIRLIDICFEVRAGEVLGIGGLMGAGRSELLNHIYGMWGQRVAGSVTLCGAAYSNPSPKQSLLRGLMLVTEDRKRFGLSLNDSVARNLSVSSLKSISRRGRIDEIHENRRNHQIARVVSLRCSSFDMPVRQLSGGNQQKVVLGRGLLTKPSVVMLDEPTRGIDVKAKQEIYAEIDRLTSRGVAVLLVTSELPELTAISDRIIILSEGKVTGRFEQRPFHADDLMAAAVNSG